VSFRVALLAACVLLAPAGARAAERVERLHLDEVVPSPEGEHDVELYLRAETRYGEPVDSLRPVDISIRDNGELVSTSGVKLARLHEADRGATIVLALDVSRTMKGDPFDRAKAAALAYIDRMSPHDRIAVIAFSDRVEVAVSFKASKGEARQLVRDLEVDRKALTTVLFDGTFKAVDLIRRGRDLPHRSFVVVFSDGKDDGSRATLDEVVDLASGEAGQSRIPVFTIGFDRFGGGSLKSLLKLSRGTSAEAFFAQSADLVASYFDEIWRQMLHSYVVRYPADLDGGHHSIEVTIGDQSDTQSVAYPDKGSMGTTWLIAAGVLVVVIGGALYARRPTSAGRLIFLEGPRKGESVMLAKPQLSIGALADNDIVVPSAAVSRYHAQIQCRGRNVEIKDVGSSNGTFVNGTNVRSCPLEPGDRVRIGDIDLVYER
jgi:Mg-chelatase subunit ChlD